MLQALADDLNISASLALLHRLSRELQRATTPAERELLRASLLASGRMLGLLQQESHQALGALQTSPRPVESAQPRLSEEPIAELRVRRHQTRQAGCSSWRISCGIS